MPAVEPEYRRLFFALWPDEEVRRQIESARFLRMQQSTTPRTHWHMTLVFLGMTSHQQQYRLERAAASVQAAPFDLLLDTWGYFARARVGWLGCRQPAQALLDFQRALESALRNACPTHSAFDGASYRYCPHVTLYRHVDAFSTSPEAKSKEAAALVPVKWPVESFSLIESRRGKQPVYRTLNCWKLSSDDAEVLMV